MDRFTVSNPTCRTDLSLFLAHHDVEPTDHFRVVAETDTYVLSQPDERLEVGTDSVALWHAEVDDGVEAPSCSASGHDGSRRVDTPSSPEARAEECTRIAFEHIENVEWHGDTIAQRDNADQSSNQMATPMEDAFRKLDRDEVSALKEALEQDD